MSDSEALRKVMAQSHCTGTALRLPGAQTRTDRRRGLFTATWLNVTPFSVAPSKSAEVSTTFVNVTSRNVAFEKSTAERFVPVKVVPVILAPAKTAPERFCLPTDCFAITAFRHLTRFASLHFFFALAGANPEGRP